MWDASAAVFYLTDAVYTTAVWAGLAGAMTARSCFLASVGLKFLFQVWQQIGRKG